MRGETEIPTRSIPPTQGGVLFYAGPSMNPLLCEGDLLEVTPCGLGCVRPGDVLAFENRSFGLIVVHRVVAMCLRGLITRGDNNGSRDSVPVCADQIVGRVSVGWRGATRFEIAGGRRGLLIARLLWLRRGWSLRIAPLLPFIPQRPPSDHAPSSTLQRLIANAR